MDLVDEEDCLFIEEDRAEGLSLDEKELDFDDFPPIIGLKGMSSIANSMTKIYSEMRFCR